MVQVLNFKNYQGIRFPEVNRETIRQTPERDYSVFDFIVFCGQKGAKRVWNKILEREPDLQDVVKSYKFPGKGQRPTPVADGDTLYAIAQHFDVVLASYRFREDALDAFVNYLDEQESDNQCQTGECSL